MSSTSPTSSSRRQFLGMGAALGASALAGCVSVPQVQMPGLRPSRQPAVARTGTWRLPADVRGAHVDEGYELPAIPVAKINKRFLRQIVPDPTGEPAGTIVVDTANHFLYLVRGNGEAIRYGVGLGRAGFRMVGSRCHPVEAANGRNGPRPTK
jgi:lipoprotein-anchoring transpeptidase ErfK/SrfK